MPSDPEPAAPEIDPSRIDRDARKVLRRLQEHGYEAYLVGGCVRDLLLGLEPKDFDIATGATPRQVKRLFRNSRIIGRRFKLAHIRFGHHVLEVATFRAPPPPPEDEDDLYVQRDNVFGTRESDAFRRDFTINALFYDVSKRRVVDLVGGLDDLEARRMRLIGEAEVRLREDPVRILRAARFAGRLRFELDPDLEEAARSHAEDLTKSAPPRVLEELYRLVSGRGAARSFALLDDLGALRVLLPEISPLPDDFPAILERLEEHGRGNRGRVPQSLMVAVLMTPVVRPLLADEEVHDYEARIQEAIRPIALRLTIARRDTTIARQCLAAQARLLRDPRGRSARRFVQREFFREALLLRRLIGPVRDVEPDPLPHWEQLAHAAGPPPEEPRKKPQQRRGRRRGRRGGRRRRRRKSKGDQS